ncbi:MAG: tripartite tricarboxylate transporter substrate-binding protein, partial [Betaproteobacteria bacterium]|nr:tripartite tricarboxylate transporter substrate-binding protein [Betaproteobacteria bacterium]
MKRSIISMTLLAAATCAAWTGGATAADAYPAKSIRFLVGYAPGGGTDTMARTVAMKLSDSLGQQVIVDNRPGANANLAAEI